MSSETIINSESTKTKRKTTPSTVHQMIDFLDFRTLEGIDCVLEPSSGSGNLLDILRMKQDFNVDKKNILCCETNTEHRALLRAKGYNLIGGDYLKTEVTSKPDFIIACPPFKNGMDTSHIEKMYKDLQTGGTIVTLCHARWMTEGSTRFQEFRSFLSGKDYRCRMLSDYSFIEKSKSVPTTILVITKH